MTQNTLKLLATQQILLIILNLSEVALILTQLHILVNNL